MGQKKLFWILLFALIIITIFPLVSAEENKTCMVYITGIGCPNCDITDPALLIEYTSEYSNLIVIEYEIYNLGAYNQEISDNYFENYGLLERVGIPFLIFNKEQTALGRFQVLDAKEIIESVESNKCPLADGSSINFEDLDIKNLPGKIKIWTKDRILINGEGPIDNELLKKLLTGEKISDILNDIEFEEIDPEPILISGDEIEFKNAIKINNWVLQWDKKTSTKVNNENLFLIFLGIFFVLFFSYKFLRKKRRKKNLNKKQKKYLILGLVILFLIGFFILAKNISPHFLEEIGYTLPLPLFTFFIALVDGFNPCNMFVLTFLLGLLISASHSKKRIYIIGFTFVFVVFFVYLLFMAAWLNIFKYIGFITPLRITIAIIALGAGLINCKELFFYRKGVTLMIQEKHKMPLMKKIGKMKEVIQKASLPVLISSSLGFAAFASLVELPCTAGFPIIYTGILSGKLLANSFSYYLYLILYNLVYVMPLAVIITIFGSSLKAKQITKKQMQTIKFIGGLIMILLGLVLLINPSLIGIGFS